MENKRRISFFLIRTMAVLILLLIAVAVFHGNCQLDLLTVSGSEHYTNVEISEMVVTSPTDQYAVLLWLRWNRNKGKNLPFIERIDATLVNKNTVHLTVYEKRVIGCVEIMGQYLYFDRDGMITESSGERLFDVPLVTGLEFDSIVLHSELTVQKKSLFGTILNLVRLIESYELSVEEIEFQYDDSVILYSGDTVLRLGKKDTYDEVFANLGAILDSLENKKMILYLENYSEKNRDFTAKERD